MAWNSGDRNRSDYSGLLHALYSVDLSRLVFPILAGFRGRLGFGPSGGTKNASRGLSGTLRSGFEIFLGSLPPLDGFCGALGEYRGNLDGLLLFPLFYHEARPILLQYPATGNICSALPLDSSPDQRPQHPASFTGLGYRASGTFLQ